LTHASGGLAHASGGLAHASGGSGLDALRRRIAAIGADGTPRAWDGPAPRVPLGSPAADRVLGGGLQAGALHELRPAEPGDMAAAAGFTLAVLARLQGARPGQGHVSGRGRPWLWVRQDLAGRETGEPYGPGLAAFGLDPAALVLVAASDVRESLRAAEEGLRCRALAGVLLEPWGEAKALDLTAMRRLSLAAEASGVTLLLLRSGTHDAREAPGPGGALTRWRIAAAPSAPQPVVGGLPGLGPPAFAATLLLNRQAGRLGDGGRWILEWSPDEHRFQEPVFDQVRLAAAAPRPRAVAPGDGPAAPPLQDLPHEDIHDHVRRAG
jgi:protein ImuA